MRIRYFLFLTSLVSALHAQAQSTPCDTTSNCCYEKCGQNRTCYCDCLYQSALSLRDSGSYSLALKRLEAVSLLCPNKETKSAVASIYEEHRLWDVRDDGKMALTSILGEQFTPYVFTEQRLFSRGRYLARHENGDYCIVDKNGRMSEMFNYILPTNNGWFKVRKNANRETFVDSNLVQIPGWDWYYKISGFVGGFATYSNGEYDAMGIVNWEGKVIMSNSARINQILNKDLVLAGYGYEYGIRVLNMKGDTLQPLAYDECKELGKGIYALVRYGDNSRMGMRFRDDLDKKDLKGGDIFLMDESGSKLFKESFNRLPSFDKNGIASAKSSGKWGLIKSDGTRLTPFVYDSINLFPYYFRAYQDGRVDYLFGSDTVNLVSGIDSIVFEDQSKRGTFRKNGRWGLLDTEGRILLPPISNHPISFYNQPVTEIKVGQKAGLLDRNGKLVIDTMYLSIKQAWNTVWETFSEEAQTRWEKAEYMGLIAIPRILFKPGDLKTIRFIDGFNYLMEGIDWCGIVSYDSNYINHFYPTGDTAYRSDRYFVCKQQGKWGAHFLKSHASIPPRFECFFFFENGFATIRENGKWGIIDTLGNYIVPAIADEPSMFYGPYAVIKQGGKSAVVDKKGDFIHGFMDADLRTKDGFVYGYSRQLGSNGYRRNYLNAAGNWVFPDSIDQYEPQQGMLVFQTGKGYGLMDSLLNVLIPGEFASIYINEAFVHVQEQDNSKRLYLTQKRQFYPEKLKDITSIGQFFHLKSEIGSKIIKPSGEQIYGGPEIADLGFFNDSVFFINIGEKCGLLRFDGSFALEPKLDDNPGYPHWDDIYSVSVNGKYGLLRKNATWVIEPQLEKEVNFTIDESKYHVIKKGKKTGIINRKGEIVIPLSDREYSASYFTEGIILNEAGRYFDVNEKGQLVVKPE